MEFVEGLYAEKLLGISIVASIAIIVVCIVWCVLLGGQLQTVFTVMSFVLSLIAGELATVAMGHRMLTVSELKLPWRRFITRLLYQVETASGVRNYMELDPSPPVQLKTAAK